MATVILQWEKEAAAHRRKEETAMITVEKSKQKQSARHQSINTPSIITPPENPSSSVVSLPSFHQSKLPALGTCWIRRFRLQC